MKRKQLPNAPAVPKAPPAHKVPGNTAGRNKTQVDALLRSKNAGLRGEIESKISAASAARSPAAMIAALDHIRPLGMKIANTGTGKAAWNATIDSALAAWEAVKTTRGKPGANKPDGGAQQGDGAQQGGFPARTKGGSMLDEDYIEVRQIPAPPAPFAPVPYPSPKSIAAAKQAGANVADAAAGAAEDAGDAAHDAADAAHDAADTAHDAAEDGANAAHDAADNVADHANDAGNNAADTVSSWLHH